MVRKEESEQIYSRTLKEDGALTWDLPLSITEHSSKGQYTLFKNLTQCYNESLREEAQKHFSLLVKQILEGMRAASVEKWTPVVVEMCDRLTNIMSGVEAIDRNLVLSQAGLKIELLSDVGAPEDSCVIPGIVLRKNIAHRRMRKSIIRPRLLLLAGALELECKKLTQLHTVINKENEFLDSAVERILAVSPDICVVERSVSWYAFELLQKANVTLVFNVPLTDMTNLALNTNAKIVENVDDIDKDCIGSCSEFYVQRVKQQRPTEPNSLLPPLMVFEVDSGKASTVVLRGAPESELELVSKALSFSIMASYRLYFENAFLTDTLSVMTEATASYGVVGLDTAKDLPSWKYICKGVVRRSALKTFRERDSDGCIGYISPHITSWTSCQSHEEFQQRTEFSPPVCHPDELTSDGVWDEPSESTDLQSTRSAPTSRQSDNLEFSQYDGRGVIFEDSQTAKVYQSRCESNQLVIEEDGGIETNNVHFPSFYNGRRSESFDSFRIDDQKQDAFYTSGVSEYDDSANETTSGAEHRSSGCLHHADPHSQELALTYPNAWNNYADVEALRNTRYSEKEMETVIEGLPVYREKEADKLLVMTNQRFTASFANLNHRKGILCEPCNIKSIDSLGCDDLSLFEFLMSIAADAPMRCPAGCGGGNSSHHRTFRHGPVRLTISVVSLPPAKAYANPSTDVWFWARPKGVSAQPMSTVSKILLSDDAKCMSLGQFLQLMCSTPHLKVFGRRFFLEHIIYFGYGRTVACIYGVRCRLKPIYPPRMTMEYNLERQLKWLSDSSEQLIEESELVYAAIQKSCFPLQISSTSSLSAQTPAQIAHEIYVRSSLIPDLLEEKDEFREEVRGLVEGLDVERVTNDHILERYLQLNQMWRRLAINVLSWSETINDPDGALDQGINGAFEDINLSIGTRISDSLVMDSLGSREIERRLSSGFDSGKTMRMLEEQGRPSGPVSGLSRIISDRSIAHESGLLGEECRPGTPFMAMAVQPFPPSPFDAPEDETFCEDTELGTRMELNVMIPKEDDNGADLATTLTLSPLDTGEETDGNLDSGAARNLMALLDQEAFESVTENHNTEGLLGRKQCSVSMPSSPCENRLLNALDKRLKFRMDDTGSATESECGEMSQLPSFANSSSRARLTPLIRPPTPASKTPVPGMEIRLGCRALIQLSSNDLVIPVFDAEPASIVAHAMSSTNYHKDLNSSFEHLNTYGLIPTKSKTDFSSGDLDYSVSDVAMSRHSSMGEVRAQRAKTAINPFHIYQKFEDRPPGMPSSHAKFEVVAYFAPQFTKLRSRCIKGGERSFVMSMSRCRRWNTSGGKSNAYFAKTLDDRYVVKSVSKAEKVAFLDKFGPSYFEYMEEKHDARDDVSIAKILGLFQVSMKSLSSKKDRVEHGADGEDLGRDWVKDLIVLENVLYGHDCSYIYDLKGKRGRLNEAAEKKDNDHPGVYLDANLTKRNIFDPPLLVDQATLDKLAKTLRRDTEFLVNNSIMDYSLLVGVDSKSNCLVVAIIDCLRPYTWDKRIETWVKSSGIIGDGNEEPTVILPQAYRTRFLDSVLGYFTVVPHT